MTYRVAFAKRFQSDGEASVLDPTSDLDVYIPDGVVADKVFVERLESSASHNQEVLDEDDAFLGIGGTEVWEYEVIDDRRQEFEDAIRNSETVMEFEVIDETTTEPSDITGSPLASGKVTGEGDPVALGDVSEGGSGARAEDGGPVGQPTGDSSAGGLQPRHTTMVLDEAEGIGTGGNGLDDLTILSEDDPSLGLTDRGDTGPDDWAADTGPSRVPDRGIASDSQTDTASTLRPDRGRR